MTLSAQIEHQVARLARLGQLNTALLALRALADDAEALAKSGTSTRRAKTPRSAKAKGRAGVVLARDWILRTFRLDPDDLLIQTTSVGGSDIHYSPTAKRVFPFAPEVKNVENLNIWRALRQAHLNAERRGLRPVLFFKRNGSVLYVAFRADDLRHIAIPPEESHGQDEQEETSTS